MKTYQDWGKQRFAIEVNSEGVRVYEVFKSGPSENERMTLEAREVWIDPHEMVNNDTDTLLVHTYANSERSANENEEAPATIAITLQGMTLTGDATGTLKRDV